MSLSIKAEIRKCARIRTLSVAQALYPRSDSIVRFLHGRPGSIEPDRCHIRIADDWRFRKIYENVIFR